ncbi:MAG: DNA repair protein RadA, partial [Actinobacteria bacterium]|nr:DNA repair protein RadA [Actinomycetota bacterium]
MAKAAATYRCTECGWTTVKWVGRCGECQEWGTVAEAAARTGVLRTLT